MNNYNNNSYNHNNEQNQNAYRNYQYPNSYNPPNINQNNPKRDSYPTMEMLNLQNLNKSQLNENNDYQILSNKIFHIDSHLSSINNYFTILYAMVTWSCFCLFSSILWITNYNPKTDFNEYPIFEKFNFIINLLFVVGYIFGIQAYTQQSAEKNKQFNYILIGFIASNFVYFFIFIFLYTSFFRYLWNILYIIINCVLYYQNQELIRLFSEKADLKRKLEIAYK